MCMSGASLANAEERAIQARHLIEEGLFAERFVALEAEYIEQWRDAKTVEERESLHAKIRAMADIRLDLVSIITTGDIAAKSKS